MLEVQVLTKEIIILNSNNSSKTLNIVGVIARLIFYALLLLFLINTPDTVDRFIKWILFTLSIVLSVIILIKVPELYIDQSGSSSLKSNPNGRGPILPVRDTSVLLDIVLGFIVLIVGIIFDFWNN